MLDETAAALARAFVTNPVHVAAFGPGRLDRNLAFFRIGVALMRGTKLALVEDGNVRGFVHWIDAPSCRVPPWSKLATLPRMAAAVGPGAAVRVVTWLSAWERHDPAGAHVHLGPIGVDPAVQRRGLGQVLMRHYCDRLDRDGAAGYLETDRPENVAFYERFGFQAIAEIGVLGVRNFLMRRS
jgi:GNAT superfamily N-acetyltransferase